MDIGQSFPKMPSLAEMKLTSGECYTCFFSSRKIVPICDSDFQGVLHVFSLCYRNFYGELNVFFL
jgi:hypothetical protein